MHIGQVEIWFYNNNEVWNDIEEPLGLTFLQAALQEPYLCSNLLMTMHVFWSCTRCSSYSQIAPLCFLELSSLFEHHVPASLQKVLHHIYHWICCVFEKTELVISTFWKKMPNYKYFLSAWLCTVEVRSTMLHMFS